MVHGPVARGCHEPRRREVSAQALSGPSGLKVMFSVQMRLPAPVLVLRPKSVDCGR